MLYRNHYIITDGKTYRAYKFWFIFRRWVSSFVYDGPVVDDFESVDEAKAAIDKILDSGNDRNRWRLVKDPDEGFIDC